LYHCLFFWPVLYGHFSAIFGGCIHFSECEYYFILCCKIVFFSNSSVQWLAADWTAEVRFPTRAWVSPCPPPPNRLWDPPFFLLSEHLWLSAGVNAHSVRPAPALIFAEV
jgi:hypothetical protein